MAQLDVQGERLHEELGELPDFLSHLNTNDVVLVVDLSDGVRGGQGGQWGVNNVDLTESLQVLQVLIGGLVVEVVVNFALLGGLLARLLNAEFAVDLGLCGLRAQSLWLAATVT